MNNVFPVKFITSKMRHFLSRGNGRDDSLEYKAAVSISLSHHGISWLACFHGFTGCTF